MPVITINLDEHHIAAAEQLAAQLMREQGVAVSRSEVFRRAIEEYTARLWSPKQPIVTNVTEEINGATTMTKDIRRNRAEKCYDVYVNGRCVARNFERYADAEAYADKYVYDALVHGAAEVA